jgi:hypothetical protein
VCIGCRACRGFDRRVRRNGCFIVHLVIPLIVQLGGRINACLEWRGSRRLEYRTG